MAQSSILSNQKRPIDAMANRGSFIRIAHRWFGCHDDGTNDTQVTVTGFMDFNNKQIEMVQPLRVESALALARTMSPIDSIRVEFLINKSRMESHIQELFAATLISPVLPIMNPMIALLTSPLEHNPRLYRHLNRPVKGGTKAQLEMVKKGVLTYAEIEKQYEYDLFKMYSSAIIQMYIDDINIESIPNNPNDYRVVITFTRVNTVNSYGDRVHYLQGMDDALQQHRYINNLRSIGGDNRYVDIMGDVFGLNTSEIRDLITKLEERRRYHTNYRYDPDSGDICVMTYNLQDYTTSILSEADMRTKTDRLVSVIAKAKGGRGPDVIVLQEVEDRSAALRIIRALNNQAKIKGNDTLEYGEDEGSLSVHVQSATSKMRQVVITRNKNTMQTIPSKTAGVLKTYITVYGMGKIDDIRIALYGIYTVDRSVSYTTTIMKSIEQQAQKESECISIIAGDFNIGRTEDDQIKAAGIWDNWWTSHNIIHGTVRGTCYNSDNTYPWEHRDIILIYTSGTALQSIDSGTGRKKWPHAYIPNFSGVTAMNDLPGQTDHNGFPLKFQKSYRTVKGISDHWPVVWYLKPDTQSNSEEGN